MSSLEPIDLVHQGERVVGVYLLDTVDGPALFDCGPTPSLAALEQGLRARGLELIDIRHLLLSHIHLDHAGAAGVLVRRQPGLQVHVSEVGAPHLVDPTRLERSARRLYGEAFDPLFGELARVPEGNIRPVGDRVLGLEAFPSPGHASHHVCYLDAEGTLYAGDAVGVRIQPGRHIAPAAPPPDVDLEAWSRTLDEIGGRSPRRLALIHFGAEHNPDEHLGRMREELAGWAERVRSGMSQEEFVAACRRDLEEAEPEELWDAYAKAAPLWQSYLGLERYWEKKSEAEAAATA